MDDDDDASISNDGDGGTVPRSPFHINSRWTIPTTGQEFVDVLVWLPSGATSSNVSCTVSEDGNRACFSVQWPVQLCDVDFLRRVACTSDNTITEFHPFVSGLTLAMKERKKTVDDDINSEFVVPLPIKVQQGSVFFKISQSKAGYVIGHVRFQGEVDSFATKARADEAVHKLAF